MNPTEIQQLQEVIAIDGPAAVGKGSAAQGVASKLKFGLLHSGDLYRTVALCLNDQGVFPDNQIGIEEVLFGIIKGISVLPSGVVRFNGVHMTQFIATEEVSRITPLYAKNAFVRASLLNVQQACLAELKLVAEGRDMAKVFPGARVKIYLDALVETRAVRRHTQISLDRNYKGKRPEYGDILVDLKERDARDTGRSVSPLINDGSYFVIQTDGMSKGEVIDAIINRWYKAGGAGE